MLILASLLTLCLNGHSLPSSNGCFHHDITLSHKSKVVLKWFSQYNGGVSGLLGSEDPDWVEYIWDVGEWDISRMFAHLTN